LNDSKGIISSGKSREDVAFFVDNRRLSLQDGVGSKRFTEQQASPVVAGLER
jgi:hypothetical protein